MASTFKDAYIEDRMTQLEELLRESVRRELPNHDHNCVDGACNPRCVFVFRAKVSKLMPDLCCRHGSLQGTHCYRCAVET